VLNIAELTMPVVEYGKDDDDLLQQPLKHDDVFEENDGAYSVIVTVPSNDPQTCCVSL